MKLIQAEFSKAQLDRLPKKDQVFFFQLTHLLDELMILQKCLIYAGNTIASKEGVAKTAQRTQALFFIRTLAGKINEGWQILRASYFAKKLSQRYDNLISASARQSLEEIKRYFREDNLINELRNKYAFHYDRQKVKDQIDRITRDEVLSMFISEHQGNNLFAFSDTMVNWSILNLINPNDPQKAMDTLVDEIIQMCARFQNFGHGFIELIIRKLGFNCVELEIANVPLVEYIELPYFVKKRN
ncbi:MAG: hypothetical protein Q7J27_01765 [Syntrophales bacterium]|nr:hypothetical protein [Syntrophales bacterium]